MNTRQFKTVCALLISLVLLVCTSVPVLAQATSNQAEQQKAGMQSMQSQQTMQHISDALKLLPQKKLQPGESSEKVLNVDGIKLVYKVSNRVHSSLSASAKAQDKYVPIGDAYAELSAFDQSDNLMWSVYYSQLFEYDQIVVYPYSPELTLYVPGWISSYSFSVKPAEINRFEDGTSTSSREASLSIQKTEQDQIITTTLKGKASMYPDGTAWATISLIQ